MNLESIKEQLMERWKTIWERVRDSDTYIQVKERYHNLSPLLQKVVLFTCAMFFVLFLLLLPFAFLSSSWDYVANFERNVNLIRDLYRVQRELASTPMVDNPPGPSELVKQVQGMLTQEGLAPEQVSGPREINPERDNTNALQPVGISEQGIELTLLKLNVKQVVDIGGKLSQMGRGLHLTALDMKANTQNDHYFDVVFRVTGFTLPGSPTQEEPQAADKPTPPTAPRLPRRNGTS